MATRKAIEVMACFALLGCAEGCHSGDIAANIDTIEVRTTGGLASYDMVMHANGQSEVEQFVFGKRRKFALAPGQFQELYSVVAPYLSDAPSVSDKSVWKPACANPPRDSGGVYLRWQGPRINAHRFVNFGCTHWWQSYRHLLNVLAHLERQAKIVQP